MYNASLFANHGKKKVTDFSTITFSPNGSNDYSFVYDDETNNAFLNAQRNINVLVGWFNNMAIGYVLLNYLIQIVFMRYWFEAEDLSPRLIK